MCVCALHVNYIYLCERGYVFISVGVFICQLAGLPKKYSTNFHKI